MPRMNAISASIVLTDHHEFNEPLMLIPGSYEKFMPRIGETPGTEHLCRRQGQEKSGRVPSCFAAFSWLWFCYVCNKA
ncbi:hypothetical protein ACUN8C_14060 [Kushneria sp. Sum13]|uniref:hypothetical protein n=1 Tax=Kushneria sp. Sum13 TaxID=3459196 RepID=UPI004045C9F9